jgi:hypothetical protein
MTASMKFRVFWDVAPCSHVEVDQRFRGAYCLHDQGLVHPPDDGGSTHLKMSDNFNVTTWRYLPKDS